MIWGVGGEFVIYGYSVFREIFFNNSYCEINFIEVMVESFVLFYGLIEGLEILGGSFGGIFLGFQVL